MKKTNFEIKYWVILLRINYKRSAIDFVYGKIVIKLKMFKQKFDDAKKNGFKKGNV